MEPQAQDAASSGLIPGRVPELVILDCDGVLIDSEIISARMLVQELAEHGVQIDLAYVARHFLGRSYPTVIAEIRRDFGVTLPDGFEEDYRNRLLDAFKRGLQIMPGVRDMLDALDVPVCVATSSSPRRVEMSLRLVDLWKRLGPVTFTAHEVAHGKPAPDLFLHAAARMGANPAACLVIEDSLPGIRAGLAAGMTVWRFTGGSHMGTDTPPEPDDARPHLRFADFNSFYTLAPALRTPR
ncbi:HAD family hydrolase [Xinfangfangia sp. D13-10-4-6]|uniref:HAD family hydrolase n=1 Tax=Pseudogemmobacter hezensis TaxID=2737662 RepID=UPI00155206FF|nr:HAD family hydrolase [Pseudogemmobacter hezensis]NPD14356.1 HAD family hydrolase [Pseudogemmobacter hezensis]